MKLNIYKKIVVLVLIIIANSCADYEKAKQPAYTLNEIIYVDRLENEDYKITLKGDGNWNVFSGESIKNINWNSSEKISKEKASVIIKNETPNKRLFFAAVNSKDTLFLSEREIDMENSVNFRDLGGVKTVDGKQVKWGLLYRSGELNELTKDDLAYVKELGIKTILDLRTDEEIEEKPDMYPENVEWKHLPIGDLGKNGKMEEMMKVLKEADPETFDSSKLMEETSLQFIESTENFKKLFYDLLNEESEKTPLLFHCTAGKDRTGFSSAFILKALGVDDKTVLDEYLLSNYFRYAYNEDLIEKAAKFYGIDQRILRPLMGVKAEWLQIGLDAIDKKYGSFDNYLTEALDVSEEDKAKLRAKFLI